MYPGNFTDSLKHLFMKYYNLSISIDQIFYILFPAKFEGSVDLCLYSYYFIIVILYDSCHYIFTETDSDSMYEQNSTYVQQGTIFIDISEN